MNAWVDLTDDEILKIWEETYVQRGDTVIEFARASIAKFKSKNTPPVVPQGEPVACWLYRRNNDEAFGIALEKENIPDDAYDINPLYTTPPSVEAMRIETLEKATKAQPQDKGEKNDVSAMADVEQNWMGSGAKDVQAAIEATKEKAAKVCKDYAEKCAEAENWEAEDVALHLDAAIRSMK